MRVLKVFAGALMLMAVPAAAQETRVAPPDHVPPSANLEQVAWLTGLWKGPGIEGAQAHESWLAPVGGTMVGTFVQETADGGIMFTEHMYLVEENGSLAIKLKHFGPDLVGWEDKDGMVTFRLVALEECAAYFSALTYRCDGDDGMVVSVRMDGEGSEVEELTFRFARQD